MKKSVLLLMLFVMGVLFASGRQVSLNQVQEIGDKLAAKQWGKVFPAEPIPYYGSDDTIIAYHLNYSVGKPFPEGEELKEACDAALNAGDREKSQGKGEYGNIVIGASKDMPVFMESSKVLSQQYFLGKKLERTAAKEFPQGYKIEKIYYLSIVDVWYKIRGKKEVKYINLQPYPTIKTEAEFKEFLASANLFWEGRDYTAEWDTS